jgi:superfamily II DNA or RNA helicase
MGKQLRAVDPDGTEMVCREMVPEWIQRMRDAATKHLTSDVVERIVCNQIKRAENGDKDAIKFVFDNLMGGSALKGATFIQNNYHDKPVEKKPVKSLTREERIEHMRRRVAEGKPPTEDEGEEDLT